MLDTNATASVLVAIVAVTLSQKREEKRKERASLRVMSVRVSKLERTLTGERIEQTHAHVRRPTLLPRFEQNHMEANYPFRWNREINSLGNIQKFIIRINAHPCTMCSIHSCTFCTFNHFVSLDICSSSAAYTQAARSKPPPLPMKNITLAHKESEENGKEILLQWTLGGVSRPMNPSLFFLL